MGSLSPLHILVVLAIVVLLFGGSRLADAGKGLGEGIRNFKKGLTGEDEEDEEDEDDKPRKLPKARPQKKQLAAKRARHEDAEEGEDEDEDEDEDPRPRKQRSV